jgi:hypothetical protein
VTTRTQGTGPPTGFFVALPDGWVSLDVDPSTSADSVRRLVSAAARNDDNVARNRVAIEQLLTQVTSEAAASGVQFCACWFQLMEGGLPVQASLTVGFHGLDGPNDPAAMLRELIEPGTDRRIDQIELDSGPAIRRSGRRRQAFSGMDEPVEFFGCQFYVPVPGSPNRIGLLSFATPTLALEEELGDLFDSMAKSFVFTWSTAK